MSLALAVILAVVDATRSIAASGLVLTPLGTSWAATSPETLDGAKMVVEQYLLQVLWDPMILSILNLPGFIVFLVLSLLFYMIGRRPARRLRRVRA